jgi:hypothetical protein
VQFPVDKLNVEHCSISVKSPETTVALITINVVTEVAATFGWYRSSKIWDVEFGKLIPIKPSGPDLPKPPYCAKRFTATRDVSALVFEVNVNDVELGTEVTTEDCE